MMKILELKYLKNNANDQCVPITLYVILQNQFQRMKTVKLPRITIKDLKKWTDWGFKMRNGFKVQYKNIIDSNPELRKEYNQLFTGQFNIEDFHQALNQHIRKFNLILYRQSNFSSKLFIDLIQRNIYPMLLIQPHYINELNFGTDYINPNKKVVRGEPNDAIHFIALHGYENNTFCVYDSDLHYDQQNEKLDSQNQRCKIPFALLQKFSEKWENRVYWFDLIERGEETKLTQWQSK